MTVTPPSCVNGTSAAMDIATASAAAFCGALTSLHFISAAIAAWRCRPPAQRSQIDGLPPVSIIRPLCGIDSYAEETLASSFMLRHADYELIFCVARNDDPVVPLIHRLMDRHRHVRARLLIGDQWISANPKLNNLVKGWEAAAHDWIVIADSNVLMPPDYLQHLLARWRRDTGLVCSPPVGCWPQGFWAEVECACLNGFQARWQLTADTLGFGFAQGKTMLWRRADLDAAGGLRALATDLAEDAAATKVVRARGLRVHLVDAPFPQPLGKRRAGEVWSRQARWAQLRRASFTPYYGAELFAGPLLPLAAIAAVADNCDVSVPTAVAGLAALWYGAEMLLTSLAGWHLSWRLPLAAIARDVLLPALWIAGWRRTGFVWRGTAMKAAHTADATSSD